MLGNVQEWCHDVYGPTYYGEVIGADPMGPKPSPERRLRAVRYGPRSSQRLAADPDHAIGIGFRVVFTAVPQRKGSD